MLKHTCNLLSVAGEDFYSDILIMINTFLENDEVPEFLDMFFDLGAHSKIIEILKTSENGRILAMTYSIMRSIVMFRPKADIEVRLSASLRLFQGR